MLFERYVRKFGLLCGRLLGNSFSLGLQYVSKYKYLIVNSVFPTSVFGVGMSF